MTAVLFGLSGLLLPLMAGAAESLAVFECQERLGRDWPATLVTCEHSFEPGRAKPGQARLVDADGNERPAQLWRVTSHPDGSIASARISFMAALSKNGSYRFQLQPQAPAAGAGPTIGTDKAATTLANALVGVRLPRPAR